MIIRFFKKYWYKLLKLLHIKPKWDYSYQCDGKLIFDFYKDCCIKIDPSFCYNLDYTLLALIRDLVRRFSNDFAECCDEEYHAKDIALYKDLVKKFEKLYEQLEEIDSCSFEEFEIKDKDFKNNFKEAMGELIDNWRGMWI